MDQIKIGRYIAEKRRTLDMTQMQLAEKLGMSNKSVSKWERGVCLPDASVYEELCSILGISINEFIAGEDLEPGRILQQSEKNIIDVSHTGSIRSRRLKLIIAILIAVIIGIVFWVLNKNGVFRDNYIEIYDSSSDEYKAATIFLDPNQISPFHYSVDSGMQKVILTVYEYKNGEQITDPQYLDTGLTSIDEKGHEVHEGKGTIAVIMDPSDRRIRLIVTNASSKVFADEEIGTGIGSFDDYIRAYSENDLEENLRAGREYAICGYYFGRDDVSSVEPADAYINHVNNPSGAEYSVIVTVRFDRADAELVTVPDLSGMDREQAVDELRDAGLMLGNIQYYDAGFDEDTEVYNQSVPAGEQVSEGTSIDIWVRKKQ